MIEDAKLNKVFLELNAGNISPLLEYVSNRLTQTSAERAKCHFNESNLQTAIQMAADMSSDFRVQVETDSKGKGFADLLLLPNKLTKARCAYLIELKYLASSDATDAAIKVKFEEAKQQLQRYASSEAIASIKNLKKVAAVFAGYKLRAVAVDE